MTTGACTVAAEVGVKMTATAAAKLDLGWQLQLLKLEERRHLKVEIANFLIPADS